MQNDLEEIKTSSLIKLSHFAWQLNKTILEVRKIAEVENLDIIEVNGHYYLEMNLKFHKYLKR